MPGRGKLVIVTMFAVALAMGAYAWWSHYQQGRQVLEFWGPDATNLIRHAEHVEVWLLAAPEPSEPSAASPESDEPSSAESASGAPRPSESGPSESGPSEILSVAGQPRRVAERRDISQVRGLVHARHALIVDSNYRWGEPRGDCQADWAFALRFEDRGRQAILVFDKACARIRLLEQDKEVGIPRPLSDLIGERQRAWASEGTAP